MLNLPRATVLLQEDHCPGIHQEGTLHIHLTIWEVRLLLLKESKVLNLIVDNSLQHIRLLKEGQFIIHLPMLICTLGSILLNTLLQVSMYLEWEALRIIQLILMECTHLRMVFLMDIQGHLQDLILMDLLRPQRKTLQMRISPTLRGNFLNKVV